MSVPDDEHTGAASDASSQAGSSLVPRGLLVAVMAALVLGAFWFLPDKDHLPELLEWFRDAGPIGWIGFCLVYLVVTLTLLPTSVFTVGGGFLFGPLTGFLVVWISENIAAAACLVVGRYLARPTVERMVAKRPLLTALDRAVRDRGFSLLVLIRHSPLVPFGVLNYGMSITSMPASTYLAATAVGTALPAFLYVYVGSTLTKVTDVMAGEGGDSGPGTLIYWGGLVATVIATVVVTRATRAALQERLAEAGIDEQV